VALEKGHSLLVVGPTQSGKTSGLAVPAILEWAGPVVATSVKTDLVAATRAARARRGRVAVYDPVAVAVAVAGGERAAWSPLAGVDGWANARRAAAGLCAVARAEAGSGLEDAGFWYATAEKLLAPLLLAAVRAGGSMADVVRWVDTGEVDEVVLSLELAGESEALQAVGASLARDERQRSSVYTTAETVLAAFADPLVAACSGGDDVRVDALLGGGEDTLYLVAPAHEQERLQAPFVCLLRSVLDTAFTRAARQDAPLDPPLLVVLDEAANVAPLAGLDGLVATAASHGVQVITLWQDLAQVEARYGTRAATVVNNHRAKLVCPGVTDPSTLDQVSRLVGEAETEAVATTTERAGGWSTTTTRERRPLASADGLRRLAPGEAVLLYADLLPARLRLRHHFADARLRALVAGGRVSRGRRRRRGRRPRSAAPGGTRGRGDAGRC
jgi:type IV secretion system protein VirD4